MTELKSLLTRSFEEWARDGRSCALSGGATAMIFLTSLRAAQVDWTKITLFWADERAVPPDDPESNYGLAERMLLAPLGAKAPRAIRMPIDAQRSASGASLAQGRPIDAQRSASGASLAQGRPADNLREAALLYDDILAHELNGGPLDLAILGVGEDGHICSLFPGHRALLVEDLRAVAIEDAPKPPPRRLSLTLRYVLQTKKIWVLAIGSRKLPVLQAAVDKTSNSTPLDLLMRQARDVTVFTDQTLHRR